MNTNHEMIREVFHMQSIYFVTRNMFAGGAERVIAQLANYFAAKNYYVKIITIAEANVYYDLRKEIEVISIGTKSKNELKNKIIQYTYLRRLIKKEKPQIVLAMPEDLGVYALGSLIGLKTKVFVSERNNPWVMPDVKITRIVRRMVYPFADGLIFQTEMAKSFFPKNIQQKGVVLNNPVDEERIPYQFQGERKRTIVSVGRLASQKNYTLLIEAFERFYQKHNDYTLHIYGDGEERIKLQKQIDSLGMAKAIVLEGRKSNVLEIINDAGVFVLPSDYEGMPNVLIEAMCMGMPVISTDCPSGGPKQLITSGTDGILVPVGDVAAMKEAMERMTNKEYAKGLSNNAYKLREKLTNIDVYKAWETYLFK